METPIWFRRVIEEGAVGADVNVVRRKLGMYPEGPFDRSVIERLRFVAKADKVDAAVAAKLGESEANKAGLAPEWFVRPLERHDAGEDVRALRKALGIWDDNRYEHDCEDAVRRFQSEKGLETTGKVDESLARLIGDV